MTEAEKKIKIQKCFEAYEKRFHLKLAQMPDYSPWLEEDRKKIKEEAYRLLGMKEEWIPSIEMKQTGLLEFEKHTVTQYQYTSWAGVVGAAHLYQPKGCEGKKMPVVLLVCGHGAACKQTPAYQALCRRLVRQGAIVLTHDNMGQGEREPMGHTNLEIPFACGITFQGMLAMESMGLLRWLVKQPFTDTSRVGVTGNSGGGALSLLVGSFSPEATVVVPTGYPSTFECFLRKDKVHCACNVLPGIIGKLEMWHILSLCAPRRLRIIQGEGDQLFPYEVFCDLGRRLGTVFEAMGCKEQVDFKAYPGAHSWDLRRRYEISKFFGEIFGLAPAEELEDDLLEQIDPEVHCMNPYPADALDSNDAARLITGKNPPPETRIWDVFPPQVDLEGIGDEIARTAGVPDKCYRWLFAQYEASLKD